MQKAVFELFIPQKKNTHLQRFQFRDKNNLFHRELIIRFLHEQDERIQNDSITPVDVFFVELNATSPNSYNMTVKYRIKNEFAEYESKIRATFKYFPSPNPDFFTDVSMKKNDYELVENSKLSNTAFKP